jgi:hypothetical protein
MSPIRVGEMTIEEFSKEAMVPIREFMLDRRIRAT